VDTEPLDNRYTKQWRTWFPEITEKHLGDLFTIVNIAGEATGYDKPQSGAFFNFAGTCEYKASQAVKIAQMFNSNVIKDGDYFFFTDAWNQTVHYIKYMSELLNIKVHIGGIWHAGWYDPTDILGASIKNREWASAFEKSLYHAMDQNFFGTYHNRDLFLKTLELNDAELKNQKCFSPGVYPFEWISELKNDSEKQDIVVFPHRLNYDKAPWIFDELRDEVHKTHPHIQFIKTQEQNLSKEQYYAFLKTCKVVFSANKHENLGIGIFEAMTSGCIPLVPNKLSYKEIYDDMFKYDASDDLYTDFGLYKAKLANRIIEFVENYDSLKQTVEEQTSAMQEKFFNGTTMFNDIRKFLT
jgi:hypothetical protein